MLGGDIGREGLAAVIGHVGRGHDQTGRPLHRPLHQPDRHFSNEEAAAQVNGDHPVEIGGWSLLLGDGARASEGAQ